MPRLARPSEIPSFKNKSKIMTNRIASMNFGIILKEYWKVSVWLFQMHLGLLDI